jgi:biopolymer transport protein ExbD
MSDLPAAAPPDDESRADSADRRAKRRYKAQARKFRRDAENDTGELNLTAMMDMMTILLVFLIKSYGAADISVAMNDDLTPPSSRSTLAPMPAVTVTITKRDIAVGERSVVPLEQGGTVIPASALDGGIIVPVKQKLDAEVEKLGRIAAYNRGMQAKVGTDKDPTRMVLIVADKQMPYSVLYSVLGTAGAAGLKYFKFLTVSSAG